MLNDGHRAPVLTRPTRSDTRRELVPPVGADDRGFQARRQAGDFLEVRGQVNAADLGGAIDPEALPWKRSRGTDVGISGRIEPGAGLRSEDGLLLWTLPKLTEVAATALGTGSRGTKVRLEFEHFVAQGWVAPGVFAANPDVCRWNSGPSCEASPDSMMGMFDTGGGLRPVGPPSLRFTVRYPERLKLPDGTCLYTEDREPAGVVSLPPPGTAVAASGAVVAAPRADGLEVGAGNRPMTPGSRAVWVPSEAGDLLFWVYPSAAASDGFERCSESGG